MARITDKTPRQTWLRLEHDPLSMRRGRQLTSGMSLLLRYDMGISRGAGRVVDMAVGREGGLYTIGESNH